MNFQTYKQQHTEEETIAFKMGQDYGYTQAAFVNFLENNDTSGIRLCKQFNPSMEVVDMVLNDFIAGQALESQHELNQRKGMFKFLMMI